MPDGVHILVAEKKGQMRLFDASGIEADQPFLTLAVSSEGERGLLGFEIDPNFGANGFVYVFYTAKGSTDRLSRFTSTDGGRTANLDSEVVLFQATQNPGLFHHGGQVRFGPDGNLWWAMGDNTNGLNPQDLAVPHGKLLRLRPDGSTPPDNPFVGDPGAFKAIWAYGLRNPFRFTFLPDGRPIVADVGQDTWEEVNIIEKGGNYGWPIAEGDCGDCPYINPVFAYKHAGDEFGASISSALIYTGSAFPPEYVGNFFYGDYSRGFIKRLVFDSEYESVISDEEFDMRVETVVDINQGADGALYYLTIYPGELFRVAPASNRAPVVIMAANPTAGLAPLKARFTSAGSHDPDGDPITFKWNFGNGGSSSSPNPTHSYNRVGNYVVTLEVSDGKKSAQDTLPITVGNRPPTPSIILPPEGATYNAGDTVTFSGAATDPEDGELPASAFDWKVVFHHNDHTHPFLDGLSGVKSGSFAVPTDPHNDPTTWRRIELTVTDSGGLSATAVTDIYPNLAKLVINTEPAGLQFVVEGTPYSVELDGLAVVGTRRLISVPLFQQLGVKAYQFSHWSDGGAAAHTVTALAEGVTYTAIFTETSPGAPVCNGLSATIVGAEGVAVIHGTPGPDVIVGSADANIIYGHGGNDVICGGDGDDVIYGNPGDDWLDGGLGNGRIYGGDGYDTIYGGQGGDWLHGGSGNDRINGDGGGDTIYGSYGEDWLHGGAGNDSIYGGEGSDIIYGSQGEDWLHSGAGSDSIYGGDDDDTLQGGDSDDYLSGGPGADQLGGGEGRDFLYGNDGDDTLNAEGGSDVLRGGSGDDTLNGGLSDDFLYGDADNDDLDGEDGFDTCKQGAGIGSMVNCES